MLPPPRLELPGGHGPIEDRIRAGGQEGQDLILDLEGVEDIDEESLSLLLATVDELTASGALVILCGAGAGLAARLDEGGFGDRFALADDRQEARRTLAWARRLHP